MGRLFHIAVGAALLCSAAASGAEQTMRPEASGVRPGAPEDVLAKGCLEGQGVGTDLLSVPDRIDHCTALSAVDGRAYDGLFHRARARMSAQDWQGAAQDFTAALEAAPEANAAAFFERGQVRFLYLEQVDAALGDFARAAEVAPDVPRYQMMQALAAIELAKISAGAEADLVGALVGTARSSLTRYLALTEGSEDMTQQIERRAAEDILRRLPKGP